jgi:hypothetical protein
MARRHLDVTALCGALWALLALRQARRRLRRRGIAATRVTLRPPRTPRAERGVHGLLRRAQASCLERALVLQRWEAGQGRSREVVIGVHGASRDMLAHAWLDGDGDQLAPAYAELMRVPAEGGR